MALAAVGAVVVVGFVYRRHSTAVGMVFFHVCLQVGWAGCDELGLVCEWPNGNGAVLGRFFVFDT